MDNEYEKKPFILELMRNFTNIFTLSVLAISFAGLMVNHYIPDVIYISVLFTFGHNILLQIAVFSFILAFFCILLITERFISRMRFWLRILLLFFSASVIFSVFAVIFKWFPIDDLQTWLGFIICTIICYVFSVSLTLLKFKLEGKKYNRLLANYKAMKNNHEQKAN